MQAVILAGGKGTRLHPYTTVLPKPLMPLDDIPILEVILRQLKHFGVEEVILAIGHLPHLFQAVFDRGQRLGIALRYAIEDSPMGTAGPIAGILPELDDNFLVMNGDLLTTLDYERLFQAHLEQAAAATIATFPRQVDVDFGVVKVDDAQCLASYEEKPTYELLVSMGVNVLNKAAVSAVLRPNVPMDIPDLMTSLRQQGKRVFCYREDCTWLDIGRVDDYQRAAKIFCERRGEFLPSGPE
jgi:NDP-mannose synthase